MDSYPVNLVLQNRLDTVNIAFSCIFFLEMIIKIFGLGPRTYIRDTYNIFDAFVVSLSIVDVCVTYAYVEGTLKTGKSAISAFRAFRLLRVFKLAKAWKQLNSLI
jgi:Ion transport protein